MKNQNNIEEAEPKSVLKKIVENPVGKIVVYTAVTLVYVVSVGACLNVFAYTINGYKNCKAALKR